MLSRLSLVLLLALLLGCSNGGKVVSGATPSASPSPASSSTPLVAPPAFYTFRVVKSYPHDVNAYTQGLIVRDGTFYESTGLVGKSSLRHVEIETGKVLKKVAVDRPYFGEGLNEMGGKLYQLTWQHEIGFIYDKKTFERIGEFRYEGEGWGLTDDGTHLILTDGTNNIRFLDPKSFAVKRTISVFDGLTPLKNLNEVEYINGEIFANIYQTNSIVRIDPKDGAILGWIDLTGLLPESDRTDQTNVLNGIAYDASKKRLFVTGKLWPKVFEIELVKQ
ncbi:MAG: glutaminyl-peptide cyclotransferase [Capsulimonadales bacterium]|nr:glutaminyl-peptide cyclotransferase [Capsulimonadales bacterium]